MILIAASVSLLAIAGGMMLLAKTQKENLSNFFKYISYFIIIAGFLNFLSIGAFGMMKMCYMGGIEHNKMKEMHKGKHGSSSDWMDGHMSKGGMKMHDGDKCSDMGGGMPCCGMMMNSCKDKMMNDDCMKGMREDACEMKKMQCIKKMEKDSVITKKK